MSDLFSSDPRGDARTGSPGRPHRETCPTCGGSGQISEAADALASAPRPQLVADPRPTCPACLAGNCAHHQRPAPRPQETPFAAGIDVLMSVNSALHAVNADWRIDVRDGQAVAVPTPEVYSSLMATPPSVASGPRPQRETLHGWTCFHCGETFTTPGGARDHFGATPEATAGCLIDRVAVEEGGKPERGRGLLMALRKAEARADAAEVARDGHRLLHDEALDRLEAVEAERETLMTALERVETLAERVPHDTSACPAIADDESDYEHLADAGTCGCARNEVLDVIRAALASAPAPLQTPTKNEHEDI